MGWSVSAVSDRLIVTISSTLISHVALAPLAVLAVSVTGALPTFTPVTTPSASTVAIEVSLISHCTAASISTKPFLTVADICTVCPLNTFAESRLSATFSVDATVTRTSARAPSAVAVTTAAPSATAVMRPPCTVTTLVSDDCHSGSASEFSTIAVTRSV